MGRLGLDEMLDQTDAKTAFEWHMQTNLFPAPPAELADRCWLAILKFNAGDLGLDDVVDWEPLAPALPLRAAVLAFRLNAFLHFEETT